MDKIEIISGKLGIEHRKVANTVKLLEDGATERHSAETLRRCIFNVS